MNFYLQMALFLAACYCFYRAGIVVGKRRAQYMMINNVWSAQNRSTDFTGRR